MLILFLNSTETIWPQGSYLFINFKDMDALWHNSDQYKRFKTQLEKHYLDEVWLDTLGIQKLLMCSESTVKRLRANGKLPYIKIGGKCYYPLNFIKYMMLKGTLYFFYNNQNEGKE